MNREQRVEWEGKIATEMFKLEPMPNLETRAYVCNKCHENSIGTLQIYEHKCFAEAIQVIPLSSVDQIRRKEREKIYNQLIKAKNGSVRDALLCFGDFKDIPLENMAPSLTERLKQIERIDCRAIHIKQEAIRNLIEELETPTGGDRK